MEVSNPRDDCAERNLGGASVPLSTVIPWVENFHLEQNTILDSYNLKDRNNYMYIISGTVDVRFIIPFSNQIMVIITIHS